MSRCTRDNNNINSDGKSDCESDSNIDRDSRVSGRVIRGSATAKINKCTGNDWRYCMTISKQATIDRSLDYITSQAPVTCLLHFNLI